MISCSCVNIYSQNSDECINARPIQTDAGARLFDTTALLIRWPHLHKYRLHSTATVVIAMRVEDHLTSTASRDMLTPISDAITTFQSKSD
jgi:hypothetical protein